ncbi:prophage LambdaSo, major tail protein V, putative [Shewanella sp. W3-18-1]|uniref:phage tail tube protein n=1 Tax=Shewanella sp. (strain W3-18-1) TaxID=351745 RepID=UPI00005FC46E|nr:phage tail tube protein [Shewanella sp. W3-18-1]ABM25297.1 prophage LambdaSo, major tail protein V, putative [Shewanella sp. W3-18-1]
MSMKTQGTQLYAIDPADDSILGVIAVTSIDGIDSPVDPIETTPLEAMAREFVAGLKSPGAATFGINIDPRIPSHLRLHQIKTAGTTIKWAIGFSDAVGTAPTVTTKDFTLPTTRTWITFEGFMTAYPFTFAQNDVVKSTIGIQVSGDPILVPAAVTP